MNQPSSAEAARQTRQGAARMAFPGGGRVAFFGGSFDPPHLGHLAVARAARAALGLDAVLFAPVGAQPLKPEGSAASFEHRLAMTRLAIAGEQGFAVSLADAPRRAEDSNLAPNHEPNCTPNYTVDALERLRDALVPGCSLFCLMGADSFFNLRHWHRAVEIPFVAHLIVASRPGQPMDDLKAALPPGLTMAPKPEEDKHASGVEVRAFSLTNPAGVRASFYLLPGLDVPISASEIRERLHGGFPAQPAAAQAGPAAEQAWLPAAVAEYIRAHCLYR